MKIVFFGTPHFAAKTLEILLENQIHVLAVVTRQDKPQGRSKIPVASPVKKLALENYLPVHQPEKASDPSFAPILQSYQADLFIVVAYGEIMKQDLLDMPKIGCINVHASLLPKYRGAAPIQRAIMNGENETGITIMHMVKKMDAGDIILQKKVTIGHETTAGDLTETLMETGSECLLKVLADFAKGKETRIPQNEEEATYAPKLELEDCQIDWNLPAEQIHNLVRGANPNPGAWCFVNVRGEQKRLKIHKTLTHESLQGGIDAPNKLIVACGQGSLELLEVQLEGKKRMSGQEFAKGVSKIDFKF